MKTISFAGLVLVASIAAFADGPADKVAEKVRPIPPPGIAVPEKDRAELQAGLDALGRELAAAKGLLKLGAERAAQLRAGAAPWRTATGLVARAFRSRIDGSAQPYGLVVPPSPAGGAPYRLDLWFHGRGETLSEVNFLAGRLKAPGQFAPPGAIVLHVYNRYCNAARFAGETDVFEAMNHVKRFYPIDPDRVVVRGFSMGGASCWGFATHRAWMWAAAAPGAGFSETADFLKVFQNETLRPPPWEQTLWRLYDATEHAANLFNVPVVAYSGEIDRQKQAADLMEKAMAAEGLKLTHIVGPATAHKYEPDAKARVDAFDEVTEIRRLAASGSELFGRPERRRV
jgi:dienelactone hydrolase